jgi:hypothetical protein
LSQCSRKAGEHEPDTIRFDYLQTSAANIFAIGDVIGGYLFTHVVAYQAGVAVRNALVPLGKKKVDYRGLNDILDTIHAYPTMNTGIQQAVFEAYLEGASASSNRRIVHTILSLRG